jgi:hypothetical protein
MPDDKSQSSEDEGFTFVDKRRAAGDTVGEKPVSPPQISAEEAATGELGDDISAADADAFGTYGLVTYVIGLLASDAWARLGLIANPATGKVEKDIPQARVAIDCVAALIGVVDTPDGKLPDSLRGDLRRVLNDLRINFVEQSKQ